MSYYDSAADGPGSGEYTADTQFCSAPIYAMVLEGENGITAWRDLAGPTNSNTAREIAPTRYERDFGVRESVPIYSTTRLSIAFGPNTEQMVPETPFTVQTRAPQPSAKSA